LPIFVVSPFNPIEFVETNDGSSRSIVVLYQQLKHREYWPSVLLLLQRKRVDFTYLDEEQVLVKDSVYLVQFKPHYS
jgi:hypothetical protein